MRDINNVLDAMLKEIPKGHGLYKTVERVKSEIRSAPPEGKWGRATRLLDLRGISPKEPWYQTVIDIWMGTALKIEFQSEYSKALNELISKMAEAMLRIIEEPSKEAYIAALSMMKEKFEKVRSYEKKEESK